MIPRIFENKTVFIVASGPSLKEFAFERLRGRNIIAINRECEFLPFATVLWWSDVGFWRRHREALILHPAPYKATCQVDYRTSDNLPPEISVYNLTGFKGFDPDPRCLRSGNNSGYTAIHLAAHLGASKLILLGFDMKYSIKGESHHHGGHTQFGSIAQLDGTRKELELPVHHEEETLRERMLPLFESLAAPLAERGITVLNANIDSALKVWPRCSIDEVL